MLGLCNAGFCRTFLPNPLAKAVDKRWFQSTSTRLYRKKKIKVEKPPRLVRFIEAGATQEQIDNFINTRAERRKATADYKAKIAEVAAVFREELRIEEEKRQDIAGAQMKLEAEEKLQEAKNLAIILQNNEELRKERYNYRGLLGV